jgi:eukaryotic-like serine/threonine-protein kinase
MKNSRKMLLLSFLLLGIMLTACTGGTTVNSWAGALMTDSRVYYADTGQVYALNSENGNIVWQYPPKVAPARLFFAQPVLVGEQLIVGDYAHLLTSLNVNDGSEKWQFKEATGRYIDAPLVVNDTIVAGNADTHLYALDLSGAKKWTYKAGHSFWAQPNTDGTTIFAPNMDHFLYAIDLATGSLKWKLDLQASLVARTTLDKTILYVGNLDGGMFAVDTTNGKIIWTKKVGGGVWSAPVLKDDKLYFGDQSGKINILNASDGTAVQPAIDATVAVLGSGASTPDGVVFGNENGELILVGADGKRNLTLLKGSIYANIETLGDRLLVVVTKGDKPLVALDLKGNEIWYFSTKK